MNKNYEPKQEDKWAKIYTLCPTLKRPDVNTLEAIDRMLMAYEMNGYKIDDNNPSFLDPAIDYLLTLKTPPKKVMDD